MGKRPSPSLRKNPILFDFDDGAHRATNRQDIVQVSDWNDVADVTASDLTGYDTIVLDTVGKALDALAQDILRKNSKHGYGGALNQQGWGQLGVRFSAYLRKVKSFGKDVVLISHMDEKADGDVIKERLKIQGGTKDLVPTDSDMMARISIYNRERQLVFSPTETSNGKDPAGFGMIPIPDASTKEFRTFLADLIDKAKAAMNALSEEQLERKGEVEWFENTLPDIRTASDINEILGRAKKAGRDVAKMVADHAKELGLEYDSEAGGYVDPENPEDTEEAA